MQNKIIEILNTPKKEEIAHIYGKNIFHTAIVDINNLLIKANKEVKEAQKAAELYKKLKSNFDTINANINNTKLSDTEFRDFVKTFF